MAIQYKHPSSDVSNAGSWTYSAGSTLYGCVDEESYSDTDYILTPKSASSAVCVLGLESATDPGYHTGHVLQIRAKSTSTSGGSVTFELMQSSTSICSSSTGTLGTSFADYTYNLTETEAGNITNYGTLSVRLTGSAGSNKYTWVGWVQLTVPDTNITLTVNSDAFTEACDNVTLTQTHILAMAAAALEHAATTPTLVELRTLADVAACAHASESSSPTLVHHLTLAGVAACDVASESSTPTLVELRTLAVDAASLESASENVVFPEVTDTELVVADADHALASDVPHLSSVALFEFLTADNIDLAQQYIVQTDSATIALASDTPTLVELRTLAVDSADIALASENVTLSAAAALAVASADLSSAAENIALTQAHTLAMASCAVTLASDNIGLGVEGALSVSSCDVALAASTPSLVQQHTLAVASDAVELAATSPTLVELRTLAPASCALSHAATSPTIAVTHNLAVNSAEITSAAGNIDLTQAHVLAVMDAALAVTSGNVTLSTPTLKTLTMSNAAFAFDAQLIHMLDATAAALHPFYVEPRRLYQDAEPRQYYQEVEGRAFYQDAEPRPYMQQVAPRAYAQDVEPRVRP